MTSEEKTARVTLTLYESGVLCNVLMGAMHQSQFVPAPILMLYEKLANANDRLMGKKSDFRRIRVPA